MAVLLLHLWLITQTGGAIEGHRKLHQQIWERLTVFPLPLPSNYWQDGYSCIAFISLSHLSAKKFNCRHVDKLHSWQADTALNEANLMGMFLWVQEP